MLYFERGSDRYQIPAGECTMGSDAGNGVVIRAAGVQPQHAILQTSAGQVAVRKASPDAEVLVNGVRLGDEPTPLLHGDRLVLGEIELTLVDEQRSGSTVHMQALRPSDGPPPGATAPAAAPTAATGGRLVSLTDGREYQIAGPTLVLGREASCDVVVTGKDVSRQHAQIDVGAEGYVIIDKSTNGTFVNDARLQEPRPLGRGDVIRIGDEEFRFYADQPPPPASEPMPSAVDQAIEERPSLQNTLMGIPAGIRPQPMPKVPVSAVRQSREAGKPLAAFLVRTGSAKGKRVSVTTPMVNIGRAEYNDLVIEDESVSTQHAKLQRREGIWMLVDLESTNGTFVDGEQVEGEAALVSGARVRFGNIEMVFEPKDEGMGQVPGATSILKAAPFTPPPQPVVPEPVPAAAPAPAPAPTVPREPVPKPKSGSGRGLVVAILIVLAAAAAAAAWFVTR